MATRTGSLITAPLRIEDDTIPLPVVYQAEVNGGAHSGATLASRNALPVYYRDWGMSYTVYNDGANNGRYILKYGFFSTVLTDNQNWVLDTAATVTLNVIKKSATINGTGSIVVPDKAMLYSILVEATGAMTLFKAGLSAGADDLVMGQPIDPVPTNFHKGIYYPTTVTVFFTGVTPQSVCSVVYFQF